MLFHNVNRKFIVLEPKNTQFYILLYDKKEIVKKQKGENEYDS